MRMHEGEKVSFQIDTGSGGITNKISPSKVFSLSIERENDLVVR
jgi:hypothetical protein